MLDYTVNTCNYDQFTCTLTYYEDESTADCSWMFTEFEAWSVITDDEVWLGSPIKAMIKVYYDSLFEQELWNLENCALNEIQVPCMDTTYFFEQCREF